MIMISVWITRKTFFSNCIIPILVNFYTYYKQLIYKGLYSYSHTYPHNKTKLMFIF